MTTVDRVESVIGRPNPVVMMKQLDRLDDGCRAVIAHSPIAGLGYRDADGHRRSTFVGGSAGFVRIHSPTRISFTLPSDHEMADGGVSFVFLLPGVGETLRLNGTVVAREGRVLHVNVEETYVHCARCIMRSHLWQPAPTRRRSQPILASGASAPLDQSGVRDFLAATPFLVLSSGDADGGSDTSPRGDQPGFVQVLDGHTVAIPDRKGNQRADTFHNLLQDNRIAFAALQPGLTRVLHVHGTGTITDDPALLATMALRGTPPQAALIIDVTGAEVVESHAVASANLWSPTAHVDRGAVPDLMALATKHAAVNSKGATGVLLRLLTPLSRFLGRLAGIALAFAVRKEGFDSQRSPDGGRFTSGPASSSP